MLGWRIALPFEQRQVRGVDVELPAERAALLYVREASGARARALGHRADIPSPSYVAPFFARRDGAARDGAARDGAAGEPLFSRPYQIENGGGQAAGRSVPSPLARRGSQVSLPF